MDATQDLTLFMQDLYTLFSDRCIERLTGRQTVSLPPSFSKELLIENVAKETVKDRMVIEQAAKASRAGTLLSDAEIAELVDRASETDRDFVRKVIIPSISVHIDHDVVKEARKKRFRRLADFTCDLLQTAVSAMAFGDALQAFHTAEQFRGFVGELLFLSCVEVKNLAGSVRFLPPFNRAMDSFIDEVVEAMEAVRPGVAAEMTERLYSPAAPVHPRTLATVLCALAVSVTLS